MMGNHFHLFVETQEANLSRGMRQLNGVYTQRFNRRHRLTGHVFEGRYKSVLVEMEAHGLELLRYIALNPVKPGMVAHPKEYRWSSYRYTAGYEKSPEWLDTKWALRQFHSKDSVARKRFRVFVTDGSEDKELLGKVVGQLYLGGKEFAQGLRERFGESSIGPDVQRRHRLAVAPALEEFFENCDKSQRNNAIYQAHAEYDYTLKEIGAATGLHYSTISKIVRRIEDEKCQIKT
jgi:hypothetical protein